METEQGQFCRNLSQLESIARKDNLVRFLTTHFKEHVHYKKTRAVVYRRHGGAHKHEYTLTQQAFDLVASSYNMKHRYVRKLMNVEQVTVLMSLENQTIGFIENAYAGIVEVHRQYGIGGYRVDLCFPDVKLVLECDEHGHADRDMSMEKVREDYIKSQGYTCLRFNPNDADFDLSSVLRDINLCLKDYWSIRV